MNFSTLGVVKVVVSGIVGIGTGKIVGKIIKDHVQPVTLIEKVTVIGASWAIGAFASEKMKKYTDEQVDSIVESFTSVKDKVKENLTLTKVNRGEQTFEESGLDPAKYHLNSEGKWQRHEIIVVKEEDGRKSVRYSAES